MKHEIPFIIFFVMFIGCQKMDHSSQFKPNSPEAKGLDLFNRMACDACHSIDGTLKLGPTMKNQYGLKIRHTDGTVMVIDDEYIRESLIDPLKHIAEGYTPIMPSYGPVLKDEDIDNLIAYIKALK